MLAAMAAGDLEITRMLHAAAAGDVEAAAALLPRVYKELRALAAARLRRLPPGQTLQATALVHEAYLALVEREDPGWNGRGHFFGAAAQAMREIVIDQARRKAAHKRGGELRRESSEALAELAVDDGLPGEDLLALDAALTRLQAEHPERAQVVLLRHFGGLSEAEIAALLGVSTRTVERAWRFARAYLHAALAPE
ncbi:ECF-type sigma factor [Nannocystis sp.]|uniref:ECF-type sigma factor n=1 Tax=Nannocystis sp. TaxID=1962667 RepID=UPI0025ECD9A7|nr:ECF-type sigma factor [Nannocystis sp.]